LLIDLVPLRIAAANGTIDGAPVAPLVAAGFTLLQRCAPLVRALAGRRSAILLAPSAAAVTALAASDGRGALILDPTAPATTWSEQLAAANVGAVFTARRHVDDLGPVAGAARLPLVLLAESPAAAQFMPAEHDEAPRRVDLGSHFGLELEGTLDDALRDEEFIAFYTSSFVTLTHHALVANARALDADSSTPALIRELILPLLAGRAVRGA
jgi:hypothetical protein